MGLRAAATLAALALAGFGATAGAAHALQPAAIRVAVASSPTGGGQAARIRRMKAVVTAWSRRLNADDNRGVARLFRIPAIVLQGPYAYRLTTRGQVALWHASLPCSGRVVSIIVRGRFATAVFELGNRKSSRCDAPGSRAAARFEIVNGKIVSWAQVAVPPGSETAGPTA
jgi:hypothetical protein